MKTSMNRICSGAGALALAMTLSSGCNTDTKAAGGDGTPTTEPGPGSSIQPVPGTKPAPTDDRAYAGIYQSDTGLDFTQPGALPGLEGPAFNLLANLRTQPGTALVNLGQAAGVEALDRIGGLGRTVLGGVLDSALINLYNDNPTLARAMQDIQNIAQIAKTTVLQTKLTVHTPSANHAVAAELQVTGATFTTADINLNVANVVTTIPAAAMPAAKVSLATPTLTPRANLAVADADLAFGSGKVTLPMGAMLMQAAGQLVFQPLYGISDFRQGFVSLIPCESIAAQGAQALADGDDFGLSSLISQNVLQGICTVAAGYLADQLIAQMQFNTDATVDGGRAVLYDVSAAKPTLDKKSDRVAEGTWSWSFSSGKVASTFAGDRVGNAQ